MRYWLIYLQRILWFDLAEHPNIYISASELDMFGLNSQLYTSNTTAIHSYSSMGLPKCILSLIGTYKLSIFPEFNLRDHLSMKEYESSISIIAIYKFKGHDTWAWSLACCVDLETFSWNKSSIPSSHSVIGYVKWETDIEIKLFIALFYCRETIFLFIFGPISLYLNSIWFVLWASKFITSIKKTLDFSWVKSKICLINNLVS